MGLLTYQGVQLLNSSATPKNERTDGTVQSGFLPGNSQAHIFIWRVTSSAALAKPRNGKQVTTAHAMVLGSHRAHIHELPTLAHGPL